MASSLIPCPSCENNVHKKALTCPGCGATLNKPKRGLFGMFTVLLFWGFNALMVLWIWGGTKNNLETMEGMEGVEAAGAAIGTGIGVTMLITLWVFGAVIFGLMALLTRPKW